MILVGVVPATAGRADFRLARRDEGAMGQSRVVVGKVLGGSTPWRLGGTSQPVLGKTELSLRRPDTIETLRIVRRR